jgi:hypothetical protein
MTLTVQIELMIAEEIITGFYRIRDFIKSKRVKYLNEKNHRYKIKQQKSKSFQAIPGSANIKTYHNRKILNIHRKYVEHG